MQARYSRPRSLSRVQHHRVDVHAVGAAAGLDEVGGQLVAEAARAEVDADPGAAPLVGEQVDEVVAGADRAELRTGQVAERRRRREVPGRGVVEQLVVDRLRVLAPDAERQRAPQVVHDEADVAADLRGVGIQQHGLVPAPDVEPRPRRADPVRVGDHPADRHGVAQVVVGHERRSLRPMSAAPHLLHGCVFGIAPDRDAVEHPVPLAATSRGALPWWHAGVRRVIRARRWRFPPQHPRSRTSKCGPRPGWR